MTTLLMPPTGPHELRRSTMSWLLRSLFGSRLRSIRIADCGIDLSGGERRQLRFAEMTGAARAAGKGSIVFPLADGAEFRASGFKQGELPPFVLAVNQARQRWISDLFEQAETELRALAQAKERLD
jgi:hypothetical protein